MKTLLSLAYFTLLMVMLTSLSKCKTSDNPDNGNTNTSEELPPITTTGAGTFGCKVNSKVWVAKSNKTGWPPTYASIDKSNKWLIRIIGMIKLNNSSDETVAMTMFNKNIISYPLYLREDSFSSGEFYNGFANQSWGTDSLIGGELQLLKFDTIHQIIAGSFYFDCINKESKDTMHITEGRFDMHYTY